MEVSDLIDRQLVLSKLESYDLKNAKVGVLASHSALDVCDGAVEEGFRTLAVCEEGREQTYTKYFKAYRNRDGTVRRGMVDEAIMVKKFKDTISKKVMDQLTAKSALFIPNRSFTSYCSLDAVENDFTVPMVGSRNLLRSEDRGGPQDYYWLLNEAGMPSPKKVSKPEDINALTIIKLHHAKKKLERGFFTASSLRSTATKRTSSSPRA